jgi:hypothetical protein
MKGVLLPTLLLSALPAVYYAALGRSHVAEIDRLQARIARAYDGVEPTEHQHARERELGETMERLATWREELRRHLTLSPGQAPFLLRASATLRRHRVDAEHAEILSDGAHAPFETQRIRFLVSGRFADLLACVRDLETGSPPCRVTELDIQPAQETGRIRASLSLVGLWRNGS